MPFDASNMMSVFVLCASSPKCSKGEKSSEILYAHLPVGALRLVLNGVMCVSLQLATSISPYCIQVHYCSFLIYFYEKYFIFSYLGFLSFVLIGLRDSLKLIYDNVDAGNAT